MKKSELKSLIKEVIQESKVATILGLMEELASVIDVDKISLYDAEKSKITTENNSAFKKLVSDWSNGKYDNDPEILFQNLQSLIFKHKHGITSENRKVVKEDLNHFAGYDEIKGGDPAASAQKIIQIVDRFIGQVERALKIAGPFLAPAIKIEALKELKSKWEGIKLPKANFTPKGGK
jgi:hypothetical protein